MTAVWLGQDHIEQQGDIQGNRPETTGNTLREMLKGEKQSDGCPRGDVSRRADRPKGEQQSDGRPRGDDTRQAEGPKGEKQSDGFSMGDDSRQADRPKGEQQSDGHSRADVLRQANRLKGEKHASGPRRATNTVRQAGETGCSLAGRDPNHDDGRSGSDYACKAESRGKPPSWRQRRSKGGNRHRNPHTRSGVVRNPDGWSYYKELVVTPRLADRVVQNELKLGRPGAPPNTTTFIMDQHSHPYSLSAPSDDWSYEEQVDDLCSFRPSPVANEPKLGRLGAPPSSTTFIMDQHSHPCNPSALRDDWSYEERVDDLCSSRRSRVAQNECWESRPGASPNNTTFIMDQHSHPTSPSAPSDDWSCEEQVDDMCSFHLARVASEPKLGCPGAPPNTTSFIMDQYSPSVPNDDWSYEEQVDDLCSSRVASEPKLGRPGAPPNSTMFIMDQYRHSYNPLTTSDELELVWRRC